MSRLKGKVALITDGASGIGEATLRRFIEEGVSVVLADIRDDRGRHLAGELGSRAGYLHADVSREADIQAAGDETRTRFGRLDCIFNNPGCPGGGGRIEEIPVECFDETMSALVRGVFLGIKHAARV